jgi:hypothetical protein
MKKIFNYVFSKIEGTLIRIGNFINQNPTQGENDKANLSKRFENNPLKGFKSPKSKNDRFKTNEIYEHKGSGYKGKGRINRDAATFNQPRKGLFSGKKH